MQRGRTTTQAGMVQWQVMFQAGSRGVQWVKSTVRETGRGKHRYPAERWQCSESRAENKTNVPDQ